MYQSGGKGGLGSACNNNSDCKMYTSDGESRLCCQQVKRGRQGWRKMCDRVSEVSRCIVSRK
ncbi:hypothetical protein NP493_194g08012 [Ridgeia piscesae]|uniref:Uncharacterized protein n=1 Tax=Ridgeia piscesae TaxID=27915 RepID=A0AAD9UEN1_RIDPI|nr:hypothetical protein NP493_194g08012 [Ridgeia piscesae]